MVVPASVPLGATAVTLNGADVTSSFTTDDRAPHALEGVLTGLPLGPSTVKAVVPGPGHSANDRTTLTLVNYPIKGPMFAGPKQPDFFCSTASHLAGFDLAGPFLDADCSLPTRVDYYYRASNATWKPYNPALPRPADMTTTTTSTGATVDFVIRWERGTIDRFIYTIAVLIGPPLRLRHRLPLLESQADQCTSAARSHRPLPGLEQPGRVALPVRPRQGLRDRVVDRDEDEHALQPRPSAVRPR